MNSEWINQQLAILVQRRGGSNQGGLPPSLTNGEIRHTNSSSLPLSQPVRLEFPKFSGEDPASWVYKANQYFKYYSTPIIEELMLASFHMEGEALIWFQDSEEAGLLLIGSHWFKPCASDLVQQHMMTLWKLALG